MEFLILVIIAIILLSIVGVRDKNKKQDVPSKTPKSEISAKRKQNYQEVDELITVILPTINNDKK